MTCSKCGEIHDPKRCQGHSKRSGKQCGRSGTDLMDGRRLCRIHGLRSPATQTALATRRAEADVRQTLYANGIKPVGDPAQALMDLVAEAVAFKELLAERLAEMRAEDWRYQSKLGAEQLNSYVVLHERAQDRLGKLLADVVKIDLQERQVRLAEAQAAWTLAAFVAALDIAGLPEEYRPGLREAFRDRLLIDNQAP